MCWSDMHYLSYFLCNNEWHYLFITILYKYVQMEWIAAGSSISNKYDQLYSYLRIELFIYLKIISKKPHLFFVFVYLFAAFYF